MSIMREKTITKLKGNKTTLLEKTGTSAPSESNRANVDADDKGEGYVGLAAYVQEYEKCPSCRMPMILIHGKNGRCYLKCSACNKTAFLTKEMANFYIQQKNVKCPTHHANIHSKRDKCRS